MQNVSWWIPVQRVGRVSGSVTRRFWWFPKRRIYKFLFFGKRVEVIPIATNLALDPALIERAVSVCGEPSKKTTVTLALKEFIARREQCNIVGLFGKLEWDDSYDYKSERQCK